MNELVVINEQEVLGKEFRIYGTVEKPLFLAKDVANWIEHSKTSMMLQSIDEDEKLRETILTSGQNREMWFLTEQGLYEVLFQSRKPIAKEFKKKVKEILKTIRKNGIYATDNTIDKILNNPDFGIELLTKLKEERQARLVAEKEVEENKPKVIFANAVATSKTSILIGELAKILKQNGVKDIGQNRLFEWLRNNGYLIRRNGTDYNMPTQKAMELKLFEIKETSVIHSDGHITVNKTPKVTGKGQQYFINSFLAE